MVGDRRPPGRDRARPRGGDRDRDRGQIILIGAIALAFIILGLVVVFNGAVFTETLAPSSAGQSASDANVVASELEQGVGGVAHRGNLEWGESDPADYTDRLENVIEGSDGYEGRYRNVTAPSSASIVNVEIDSVSEPARAETGQSVSGVSTSINRQVGHLALDLESDGSGQVNVTDLAQGKSIVIDETSFGGTDYGFRITDDSGATCLINDDRTTINLVTGTVNATTTGDCDRTLLDPSATANVLIDGNSDAVGTYDIVVKRNPSMPAFGSSEAAWHVDATVTYESNEATYQRTQTVPVYGDPP